MALAMTLIALCAVGTAGEFGSSPDGIPFVVADQPWAVDGLGNHRAIVSVSASAPVVRAHIPWRRRDSNFASKAIIVTPLGDPAHREPTQIVRSDANSADIDFAPDAGPGLYACYYLPFRFDMSEGGTNTRYLPTSEMPELPPLVHPSLPMASTRRMEARTAFDSFAPMELPATEAELTKLDGEDPSSYWVFTEDRTRPVRMFDRIPAMWADRGTSTGFYGKARPNEYYVFQLGVCARHVSLRNVKLEFSDLKSRNGQVLSAHSLTCFNLGGTNWDGSKLTKRVNVAKGEVMPLWIGVDIPEDVRHGTFLGKVRIVSEYAEPKDIVLQIDIAGKPLTDRGDSDLWRYARLRWLNSTLGANDVPIAPYKPIQVNGNRLKILGRSLAVGDNGLPEAIAAGNKPVLKNPIAFGPTDAARLSKTRLRLNGADTGRVTWRVRTDLHDWVKDVKGELEFDGHASFTVTCIAKREMDVPDIGLVVPYAADASTYFMGIGHRGGNTPEQHRWDWKGPYDSWWMGGVEAGMQVELRGGSYHGPLLNLYHPNPPAAWFNKGNGTVVETKVGNAASVRANTGPLHVKKGERLQFEFALLITPVKPIDTKWQFRTRFYHNAVDYSPLKAAIDAGANVVNVHHANDINPYINYPFREVAAMRRFVDMQHAANRKVKIYDTIRELSNYTAEIWPLLALDGEVFVKGGGGGFAWLQEHVGTGYIPSWYHPYAKTGTADASIVTTGFSRWINYYVEGLSWLAKNVQMDGLYLDDVSFDRRVLKRMRRVLADGGRSPMIDLHSNTGFSIGPANQYTEFFPYVDRLWFGESFDYNQMSPDRWLVETSGIPFGLMGEMLQGGGNRWLGMVYGMTTRFGWTNYEVANNPDPIWRYWDRFGIAEAEMIGYWNPKCPVRVDSPEVRATIYRRNGKALIAIANFGEKPAQCRLTIDWARLGLDPDKVQFTAPEIANYQKAHRFVVGEPVPIDAKKGWLIEVWP